MPMIIKEDFYKGFQLYSLFDPFQFLDDYL